jgi:hypothetical protein
MKAPIALILALFSMTAHAEVIQCTQADKPQNYVEMMTDGTDRIIQATENRFVVSDKNADSIFAAISGNITGSGYEIIKTALTFDNYSMVSFITATDVMTVGFSEDDKSKGFYSYVNTETGDGNVRLPLACKVVPALTK